MGGVGIALPQDGLWPLLIWLGIAFVGDRVDLGLTWFMPNRSAEITGNGFGANGDYSGNDTRNFFIPSSGLRQAIFSSTVRWRNNLRQWWHEHRSRHCLFTAYGGTARLGNTCRNCSFRRRWPTRSLRIIRSVSQ